MKYFLTLLLLINTAAAQDFPVGYPDNQYEVVEESEQTVLSKVLLWIPNRVVDFVDIFRIDVGVGRSTGAVVRVTKSLQAGYRTMSPASFRLGAFGRDYPFLVETSNEIGFSPVFKGSQDRTVCNSEVGVGADLFIVGAYGGICVLEIFDFIGGIFFLDLNGDDW